MNSDDKLVWDALEIDRAHRYLGVTGDIYITNRISRQERWTGTLPNLSRYPQDSANLDVNKLSLYDILDEFTQMGFIICGKGLAHIFSKNEFIDEYSKEGRDIDLYFVNKSPTAASVMIRRVIADLNYTRMESTIIIQDIDADTELPIIVRIHLHLFSTISELLHSMDMGSEAIAWDGLNLYFTTMGLLAYQRGINIVDLTKHSMRYDSKLEQFQELGFDTVMPNLDAISSELEEDRSPVRPTLNIEWKYEYEPVSGNNYEAIESEDVIGANNIKLVKLDRGGELTGNLNELAVLNPLLPDDLSLPGSGYSPTFPSIDKVINWAPVDLILKILGLKSEEGFFEVIPHVRILTIRADFGKIMPLYQRRMKSLMRLKYSNSFAPITENTRLYLSPQPHTISEPSEKEWYGENFVP